MKRFFRFGLEEKMLFGYLPIIVVIILIAVISLLGHRELDSLNQAILKEDTMLAQISEKMADNLLAQEAYGKRFLILHSPEMKEMFWERGKDFNNLIKQLDELPQQVTVPRARLASLHDEFEQIFQQQFSAPPRHPPRLGAGGADQSQGKLDELLTVIQAVKETAIANQQQKMLRFGGISLNIFRITILLSGLGVAVGLGSIALITRSISRSIKQLKLATEQISQGKFDHLAEIKSRDELGELARAFNYMASRLGRLEEIYIDSSPLTRLPGGVAIEKVLKTRLAAGAPLAFCMLDLDNFKSFNDRYGYAKGNEVILATAELIKNVVTAHGIDDDFVGHIGGDDFTIIAKPENYQLICETIIREFDRLAPSLYKPEDRLKGYIEGVTRQGLKIRFPLMSISIAVVTNEHLTGMNHIEIAEIAAELKEHAKSQPGSVYVVNRRVEKAGGLPAKGGAGFLPKVVK